jgi:DNA replicative helicase MCM subunit Mcm2 (Cdc46/Mcm family)
LDGDIVSVCRQPIRLLSAPPARTNWPCYCLIFVIEAKPESCRDYQEIKVQELIQNLAIGTIPRSMWVVLEDDLVDSCKPGDDVTICGIVMRRWKSVKIDVSIQGVYITP